MASPEGVAFVRRITVEAFRILERHLVLAPLVNPLYGYGFRPDA